MNHSGAFLLQRMFQKMQTRQKVKVESLEDWAQTTANVAP